MPTGINYLTEVWNTVHGCTPISAACARCYASAITHRFHAAKGLTNSSGAFNGKVVCDESKLTMPLHWKRPRVIGCNFMADTFHDAVPDHFIDRIMAVAMLCPQHRFMFLTKRAKRMAEYFSFTRGPTNVLARVLDAARGMDKPKGWTAPMPAGWPYPNVYLGVTVEDQQRADERLAELAKFASSGWATWISAEPLLEAIDILPACGFQEQIAPHFNQDGDFLGDETVAIPQTAPALCVCGCESGPGRRRMRDDWARRLRDQCQAAGVAFWMKQCEVNGRVTENLADFPADLRIRQTPGI